MFDTHKPAFTVCLRKKVVVARPATNVGTIPEAIETLAHTLAIAFPKQLEIQEHRWVKVLCRSENAAITHPLRHSRAL
jgi:hypothetical protein